MALIAARVAVESATTFARFTAQPESVTDPRMMPVFAMKSAVGYRLEMPEMSSAASGVALVVARVIKVDMALEVCGCCRPSAWPNSCTTTVKNTSCQLASGGGGGTPQGTPPVGGSALWVRTN